MKTKQTRVRKVPIKTIKPHTNFAEEIYQSEKTDRFLDRIFYTGCAMLAVLAITYIIVNIK